MKKLTILSLIFATLFANAQSIIAPDTISTNTVWADTIFLNTDVYIENGIQLKIKPGATVIANGWFGLDCQGQLLAQGTEQDSILFTVADTTNFYDLTKVLGGWRGINFDNTPSTNDSSIINFCIIEYGKACDVANGTKLKGGAIYSNSFSKLSISNSMLKTNYANKDGGAICLILSSVVISNNIIKDNFSYTEHSGGGGIYVSGTSVTTIKNNVFNGNFSGPLICQYGECFRQGWGAALHINVTGNSIQENRVKVISNKFYNNDGNDICYDNSLFTLFSCNILTNNNYGTPIFGGGGPYSQCIYTNNTIVNNNTRFALIDIMETSLCYNNIVIYSLNGGSTPAWWLINIMDSFSSDPGSFSNVKNNYIQHMNYTIQSGDTTFYDFNIEGEGNIYGNVPEFINPTPDTAYIDNWQDYDWRLQNTSPCINAGILDTSGLDLPEEDAFGNPRIFGNRIDIGAYENQTEIWTNVFSLENKVKLTFYPNPVQNSLNIVIKSKELQNKELQIFDINGKIVKNIQITSSQASRNDALTIDVSDLETGVYYLRVGGLSKEFIKY